MRFKTWMITLCSANLIFSCQETANSIATTTLFADTPVARSIAPGFIDEASGIAESKINPGYIWVEQDSGNPPELALLSMEGKPGKKIVIKQAANRDWEDMALVSDPNSGAGTIYIADIGDNLLAFKDYSIYRFPEPAASGDTVSNAGKITFTYPDGPHDAEAMLVDRNTKDIFVITKNDTKAKVFRLAAPQSTSAVNASKLVGELPFGGVVSAAISPDSREIIIKTYTALYYWVKEPQDRIDLTLTRAPTSLRYQLEVQGEAVCFAGNGSGFYTLSEKPVQASGVALNYYKRN